MNGMKVQEALDIGGMKTYSHPQIAEKLGNDTVKSEPMEASRVGLNSIMISKSVKINLKDPNIENKDTFDSKIEDSPKTNGLPDKEIDVNAESDGATRTNGLQKVAGDSTYQLEDKAEFDIYEGLDDELLLGDGKSGEALDPSYENRILEEDGEDLTLVISPSPRSSKSMGTDDCFSPEKDKMNLDESIQSETSENCDQDKEIAPIVVKLEQNCTESDVFKASGNSNQVLNDKDIENTKSDVFYVKNNANDHEDAETKKIVENLLYEKISDICAEGSSLKRPAPYKESVNCCAPKKQKTIAFETPPEDISPSTVNEEQKKSENRNLFQMLNETKIHFEHEKDEGKINCVEDNNRIEESSIVHKDPVIAEKETVVIKKEPQEAPPVDVATTVVNGVEDQATKAKTSEGLNTEKMPKAKQKRYKFTKEKFEDLVMGRLVSFVNKQIKPRFDLLNARSKELETALRAERMKSNQLHQKVEKLNKSISLTSMELQKINHQKPKPGQRTVGVQVRFSSEQSLSSIQIMNANNRRQILTKPQEIPKSITPVMTSTGNAPMVLANFIPNTIQTTTADISEIVFQTSGSRPGIESPKGLVGNLTYTTTSATKPNSGQPAQVGLLVKPISPTKTAGQSHIIDLTADEEENRPKNMPRLISTPISQANRMIQNSSRQILLTPQVPGAILPGPAFPTTPSNNPSSNIGFVLKANNSSSGQMTVIPSVNNVPPGTPNTSLLVSTVRLPGLMVKNITPSPNMKISTTTNQPQLSTNVSISSTPNRLKSITTQANNSLKDHPKETRTLMPIMASKHPAPLPKLNSPNAVQVKNCPLPPQPVLRTSRVDNGIVLSWSMNLSPLHAAVTSYILFAYQEGNSKPSMSKWKKVGDVKALPLPMACTLTQFVDGHQYHFAVCAVDVYKRIGPFSKPGSIMLTPFPKKT